MTGAVGVHRGDLTKRQAVDGAAGPQQQCADPRVPGSPDQAQLQANHLDRGQQVSRSATGPVGQGSDGPAHTVMRSLTGLERTFCISG